MPETMSAAELWQQPRHLCAASGSPYNYHIPEGAQLFRGRVLARRGDFFPHLPNGQKGFQFDDAFFERMVASYDPQFFAARCYPDHPFLGEGYPYSQTPPSGPTPALVLALAYDKAKGELLGDIVVTDWYFGHCLAQGQYPDVSIEWWDSQLLDGELFYGEHETYLTGAAALGVIRPAIPCGPWPQPEVWTGPEAGYPHTIPYVNPLAAQHVALAAHNNFPPQEAVMPNPPTEAGGQGASPPAAAATGQTTEQQLAAALDRINTLEAAAAQRQSTEGNATERALSAAQQRIANLERDARAAQLSDLVRSQYEAGHLTPAAENDFRAAVAMAQQLDGMEGEAPGKEALACAQAAVNPAAAGADKVAKRTGFLDLVLGLAAHLPGTPTGVQAGADKPRAGEGRSSAATLSQAELAAAKACGMTPEAFAAAKAKRAGNTAGDISSKEFEDPTDEEDDDDATRS